MSGARKTLLYLVYIAIIVGIGTAIMLQWRSDNRHKVATKPVTSTQQTVATTKKKSGYAASTSTKTPSAADYPPKTTTKPAPAVKTPVTSTQLADTGPGNVLTLFIVSTLLAAVAHRRHMLAK